MKGSPSLSIGRKPAPDQLIYVQGFVNTVDLESGSDTFATPEGVAAWFSHHGRLSPGTRLTEADRQLAVSLREAVRRLLRANHGEPLDQRAIAVLSKVGAEARLRLAADDGGALSLEPVGNDLDASLAELLAIMHRAMLTGSWQRLKVCGSESCQWAFYDSSRNRSGTWCSMEVCGNREKVRGHRQRTSHEARVDG